MKRFIKAPNPNKKRNENTSNTEYNAQNLPSIQETDYTVM